MGAPPPDPATATDAAAFVTLLSRLRSWAGNPTLRSLRVLGGTTVTNGGDTVDALPVSTISYVLRGVRLPQLPRKSFVDAYVTACFRAARREPEDAPARWVEAWQRLRGGSSSGGKPSTIPGDVGDFTGRAGELARILGHVTHSAGATGVVAISGAAGVGKTTLALRVAHRLAAKFAAVHFLDLRKPRTPLDALTALLPGEAPASLDAAVARWRAVTASAKTLVVLDDCLDAAQIEPLLPVGPGCMAIVTSRARLTGLDGAHPIALGVFPAEQASALLARIIGEDRVRADPEAVAALVARVGALPLAVRTLGAALRHRPRWPLAEVLEHLPETGAGGAFDLAYRQLPEHTRRVFRLLALHPGELGPPAAAALTGRTREEAGEELERLTGAHLVEQPEPGRYRQHDLLADYAAGLLSRQDDRSLDRLLTWYLHGAHDCARLLGLAMPAAPGGRPAEPHVPASRDDALAWFETERRNLVAAVGAASRRGSHTVAWRLAVALSPFFQLAGYPADWIATHETALPGVRDSGDAYGEAWLLNSVGIAYRGLRRDEDAVRCWSAALEIRERIGDDVGTGLTLNNLAAGLASLERWDESVGFFRRSLEIWTARGEPGYQAMALTNLADLHRRLEQWDECVSHATRAAVLAREAKRARSEAIAVHARARGLAGSGRLDEALHAFNTCLRMLRDQDERWGIASTQRFRGEALLALGDEAAAIEAWRESAGLFAATDDPQAADVAELLHNRGVTDST